MLFKGGLDGHDLHSFSKAFPQDLGIVINDDLDAFVKAKLGLPIGATSLCGDVPAPILGHMAQPGNLCQDFPAPFWACIANDADIITPFFKRSHGFHS